MYRGAQRWRCGYCGHVFTQPKREWARKAYLDYVLGKQTLAQLSTRYGKSVPTLRKHFDRLEAQPPILTPLPHPVSLVCDTTFFGRKSALHMLRACYPDIPVQTCQFHLMQNVRRTLGAKPKTSLGKELLRLTGELTVMKEQEFTDWLLYFTDNKYRYELGLRKEASARKAVTAIRAALPYLPVGKYHPDWAIIKVDDETLYLIRETKSTKDFLKLRTSEADKVAAVRNTLKV